MYKGQEYNVFNDLGRVLPFLRLEDVPDVPGRGARLRVFASAQHPIALSAAMVMLVPLAAYLAVRTSKRIWWLAGGLMIVAAVATISRTGILMLGVVLLVFAVLRPADARRALPIGLPLLIMMHLAIPGALGSLHDAFVPEGGLVAEQESSAGQLGSGRVADLGPALDQAAAQPVPAPSYRPPTPSNTTPHSYLLDTHSLPLPPPT